MNYWIKQKIGWRSATSVVIANMVGTGVFTTLGLQLEVVQNGWSILLLWVGGAIISLLGAFSYAEVGTHLPRSGGEYHFLSRTVHPVVGYLSGWVSLTVGFAAPIALAAMAMGAYLEDQFPFSANGIALSTILVISLMHSFSLRKSSGFQNFLTLLKLGMLVLLVVIGLGGGSNQSPLDWGNTWRTDIFQSGYAVALIYVTYAYSGWNAAAYIVGEIRQPGRHLPIALIGGTLTVSVLYILLQFALLRQAPIFALQGQVEIGQIAAEYMLGNSGARWVSVLIAFLLVSSISAMIWVGPRISRAMSADYRLWRFLNIDNRHGVPVRAIWFQSAISMLLILTGSFESVLLYSGFVLQLFTAITVGSVFRLRRGQRRTDVYRSPGFPWVQLAYIGISVWIIVFTIWDQPLASLIGLGNLGFGLLTWFLAWKLQKRTGSAHALSTRSDEVRENRMERVPEA